MRSLVIFMQEKYLKRVCENVAERLFYNVLHIFNYPHNADDIERAKRVCYSQLFNYNEKEVRFIKEKIDELFQEYKDDFIAYV